MNIDNALSLGHTLTQITCQDRRGIPYDCMRVLRDPQPSGPDTELLVVLTVEKNGGVRPRMLYDATLVSKMLEICKFKVDSENISRGDKTMGGLQVFVDRES